MPYSNRQAAEQVLRILGRSLEELPLPLIYPLIPVALNEFARAVAGNPLQSELLTKDFDAIAVVAGVADISNWLDAAEPLIAESFETAAVVHSESEEFCEFMPSAKQLRDIWDAVFTYYTFSVKSLIFRNPADGLTNTLGGTVTASASFIPLITNLPQQLQLPFCEFLARFFLSEEEKKKKK